MLSSVSSEAGLPSSLVELLRTSSAAATALLAAMEDSYCAVVVVVLDDALIADIVENARSRWDGGATQRGLHGQMARASCWRCGSHPTLSVCVLRLQRMAAGIVVTRQRQKCSKAAALSCGRHRVVLCKVMEQTQVWLLARNVMEIYSSAPEAYYNGEKTHRHASTKAPARRHPVATTPSHALPNPPICEHGLEGAAGVHSTSCLSLKHQWLTEASSAPVHLLVYA
jgi:hypothetical protein